MSISNLPVPGDNAPKAEAGSDPVNSPATSESSVASNENPPSDSQVPAQNVPSPEPSVQSPSEPTAVATSAPEKSKYDLITDALLSRIGAVGSNSTFKMCVYGPPGGTKTSFLGLIPNNLVYDMEDGAIAIASQEHFSGKPKAPGVNVIPFKSFQEAELLMERLLNDDPAFDQWGVFSIDTFSDFHKRALSDLMKNYKKQMGGAFNQYKVETDQHAENNLRMLDFVRNLRDLNRDIVITAHARTVEPKNKPAKTYPDFSESLANKIEAMMDVVGYMEMMQVEDGKPPVPVMRVISEGTTHAKTRIPLPEVIINPSWSTIKAEWTKWKDKTDEEKQAAQQKLNS